MNASESDCIAREVGTKLADIVEEAIAKTNKDRGVITCPKCGQQLCFSQEAILYGELRLTPDGSIEDIWDDTDATGPVKVWCIDAEDCKFEVPQDRNDDLLIYLEEQKKHPQTPPGETCPKCDSNFVYWCSVNIDGIWARQDASCGNCDAEWTDFYKWDNRVYIEREEG